MDTKLVTRPAYVFDPETGPAKGVQGAWPFEQLQLQQVRILPSDFTGVESRKSVELRRTYSFPHTKTTMTATPLIAANMFGVGTIPMAQRLNEHDALVAFDKHLDVQSIATFINDHDGKGGIPTVGFTAADEERLSNIFSLVHDRVPKTIMLDVPNGHMTKMLEQIRHYRAKYPEAVIMAGNVASGSMAREIIVAGADVVKVGIGPGGACTTKNIAGVHRPQFAAIRECAEAVHSIGGFVIGDGGVQTAGDVGVALAAGADFVMVGSVLSSHDESGEPIYIDEEGHEWMEFMGSSSAAYMNRTKGEVGHYKAAEGEFKWVPYKGPITAPGAILNEIMGGLRSAFSYAGAFTAEEFADMARKTYRGESGGIYLVKAEIHNGAGRVTQPSKIIGGRSNPLTGAAPNESLYQRP